jgi:hypothetical protein
MKTIAVAVSLALASFAVAQDGLPPCAVSFFIPGDESQSLLIFTTREGPLLMSKPV